MQDQRPDQRPDDDRDRTGSSDDDRQPADAGQRGTLADEEGVPTPLPPRVTTRRTTH